MYPDQVHVSMANTSLSALLDCCTVDLELQEETYTGVRLKVLTSLCSDVVLGHEILQQHSSLEVNFGGKRPPLTVCKLAAVQVPVPTLQQSHP